MSQPREKVLERIRKGLVHTEMRYSPSHTPPNETEKRRALLLVNAPSVTQATTGHPVHPDRRAGSVVSRDIPAMAVAVRTPCRVLREMTEEDLRPRA